MDEKITYKECFWEISKLMGETYKQYDKNQQPFINISLIMDILKKVELETKDFIK